MKKKILILTGAALMLATLLLLTACGDSSPYGELAEDGYTVCVRYDANGGDFACNGTYISVVDVYHSSQDSIKLFPPDSPIRQPAELRYDVQLSMSSYKFVGWFPAEVNDKGEVVDEDGNPVSVSGKEPKFTSQEAWDFEEQRFKLDKSKTYSRDVPAITLCAKWEPHYTFEFYVEDENGNWINFTKKNKEGVTEKLIYKGLTPELPSISSEISNRFGGWGNWDFYGDFDPRGSDQFPSGYTLMGLYLSPECTEDSKIPLTSFDTANVFDGEAYYEERPELDFHKDPVKIYTKIEKGNWFLISSPDKLSALCKNIFNKTAGFEDVKIKLIDDLDFSESKRGWLFDDPASFASAGFDISSFEGFDFYIDGNGYSIKLPESDLLTGSIFGKLSGSATVKNLTVEGAHVKYSGTDSFAMLADDVADGAVIENVRFVNCTLDVDVTEEQAMKLISGETKVFVATERPIDGLDASGVTVNCPEWLEATIDPVSGQIIFNEK
ncbi:MAG: hypothetical protein IKB38_03075 [Clostridia bacterium]|nr:hypothetical protein [Clostridia bacterium]